MVPDPIGQGAIDKKRPKSLNRYSYTENDPVNFSDPGGTLLAPPEGPGFSPCSSGVGTLAGAIAGFTVSGQGWGGGFTVVLVWGGLSCNSGGDSVRGGGGEEPKRIKPQVSYVGLSLRVGQCADVQVDVGWKLFGGANADGINGWVIQHIQSVFTVKNPDGSVKKDANGNPLMVTKDFYEAWQVINGEVQGGDTYLFKLEPHGHSTQGSYRVVGTANFFWDDEISPKPSTWDGREPDANGLPNRGGRPSG